MHYGLPTDDVKLRLVPYHYERNGSRDFCCPLTLTLTLTGIFAGSPGHLTDKLLHALGGLLAHFLGNVAVYVQGEAGRGVAQVALHRFNIVPGADGGHGVRVPEVMHPCVRASNRGGDCLKRLINGVNCQVMAVFICEH